MRALFVCVGNICRSPMAEAIATHVYEGTGWEFASAGLATIDGRPPAPDALAALAELGIEGGGLRSKQLRRADVAAADRLYGMEPGHVDWIRRSWPEAADRVALLDPGGAPIADPYGLPYGGYVAARDRIVAALALRSPEWTPTVS